VSGNRAVTTVTGDPSQQVQLLKGADGGWRIDCCAGQQIDEQATSAYRVPSGSMEPTLKLGQLITSNNAAIRVHPPAIGDIIVFHPPAGADPANAQCGNPHEGTGHQQACDQPTMAESSQTFIKRVVAGPGDMISMVNGHVIRNGVREQDSYIYQCGGGPDCNFTKPIVIPAGEYFVLGDNRGQSDDSRFWGPVKRAWIIGVVTR
jgi:signal peptidase I